MEPNFIKDIVIPLASAFVGGGVGGALAIKAARSAARDSLRNEVSLQTVRENQTLRGYLLGIQTELHVLVETYEFEFGTKLEEYQDGTAFDDYYPLTQNYFTVFETGALLLGTIPNDELRSRIVQTYILAKGVVDTHRHNNDLIEKRNAIVAETGYSGKYIDHTRESRLASANAELSAWGPFIPANYREFKRLIGEIDLELPPVLSLLGSEDLITD